jgi:DNA-binding YbaB/EbfC family protein
MKLPKGLGDFGSLMKQAKEAMERAKHVEAELQATEVEADKNGVHVKMNGAGDLLSIKISPDLVDPYDIETLEDAITMAMREGQVRSNEVRQEKMREITGDLPLPPGLGL